LNIEFKGIDNQYCISIVLIIYTEIPLINKTTGE